MEKAHQDILKRLRKNIVIDMDVHNGVISPLVSEYILKEEDIKLIESGKSKEEKAQILLDILPSCGPYAFDTFRQALRHHYGWLSDDMDKLEANEFDNNDAKYSIDSPILPPLSPLTVTREEKMTQLKESLRKLKPNEYIVLHGMKGFGKSCLTASTLKDTALVNNLFYNKVYWLKFGSDKHCKCGTDCGSEQSVEEEIMTQLNVLYHLVRNVELLPETIKSESLKDSLIRYLRNHFSKKKECNSLLILDDVSDNKIIRAFDFECKTLVITTDIDVLDEKRCTIIEMNDGFTEAETLGLFAKVLDIDIDKLPAEAKLIHVECKGMPLLIAMFSAQFEEFKDDMKKRPDRWQHYLRCVRKGDEKNKVISKFLEKQETVFNMCIERLSPELKKCYEHLAIFSEDVNIMPTTLKILWEIYDEFQVEDMMLELCHKSLAAKQWNDELGSYIYGVHDLLLRHLRKKIGQTELKEMHKSFIAKYRKYCNGDFSKLPNDNYSHSFIGHHLELAELYSEFPKLYLDFNFLQAKIIRTGLSDLLIDLKKYRKYITSNYSKEEEAKVLDLEKFLHEQASNISEHRRKGCLDLVQIAMYHIYPGYITKTATELAKKKPNHLYLSLNTKLKPINVTQSEEVCTEICTSCFTDDPDVILVGSKTGEIIQWNCKYKQQKVYNGFNKKCVVKKIVVSGDGYCFLALSNGIIKLFPLNYRDYYDQENLQIRSPRQKQTSWSGLFENKLSHDDSEMTFSIDGESILDMTFGHDDTHIAACSNVGKIYVWNRTGVRIAVVSRNLQNCFRSIAFTTESNLLHTMEESDGILVTYKKLNEDYVYATQFNPQLERKKIIFFHNVAQQDDSLVIVTENKAVYVKWFYDKYNSQFHSYKKQVRGAIENDKTTYTCAAITYDGKYLILADTKCFVNIWNVESAVFEPIATYRVYVTSLDTYWLKDEDYHLICGSENSLLHRWKFPVGEVQNPIIRELSFDAIMRSFEEMDVIAVETHANTVIASIGDERIAESDPVNGKVKNLKLSPNGNKIVYITDKGIVTLFDLHDNKTVDILKSPQFTNFVTFLTIGNDEIIVCSEDNNLRVWENNETAYLLENAGYIISVHPVNDRYVITITKNGVVTLYNVLKMNESMNWTVINRYTIEKAAVHLRYSCLSSRKNLIAALSECKELFLCSLQEDTTTRPITIEIKLYHKCHFGDTPTCCEFSQDEKYLAVGFETGNISIINVEKRQEIHKFSFHTGAVTQLSWAPLKEIPLLLSVNRNELAWWNIQLANQDFQQIRRSRRGINRSISTPVVGTNINIDLQMPTSQSVDVSSIQLNKSDEMTQNASQRNHTNEAQNIISYWKYKAGRNPSQPALLHIIRLPLSCATKVCISKDFSKFLTVDVNGAINTYKLFGYC